jgi:hypothetical protein
MKKMKNKIIVKMLVFVTILLFLGESFLPSISANEESVKKDAAINKNYLNKAGKLGIYDIYFVYIFIDYLPSNCVYWDFAFPLFMIPKKFVSGFLLDLYEGNGTVTITQFGKPMLKYKWPEECSFLSIKTFFALGLLGGEFAFYESDNGNALVIRGVALGITWF